jgi:hypothetical protein
MNIVKQSTGNVVLTDAAGNIQKVFVNVNALDVKGTDEVIVKFGFNQWHSLFASQVSNTQIEPAAAVAFSGNAFDLVALLSSSFFFELSGGGGDDLATVLALGNTSGPANIVFDTGEGITFTNNSALREGTTDAGLGGSKGIAQICAVGYELKWEAGRLYVMDGNGTDIRWSLYNFSNTPAVTDDVTKGYQIGSRWTLDDGSIYLCSDASTGAAVWVLEPSIPTKTSDLINDGDDGVSHFISLNYLPSNLILYATTAASDIPTYFKLVDSITDPSYDAVAVNVSTGAITGANQFISALATPANVIVGNPGVLNISTIGNIRRTAGTGNAEFYFEVWKRDLAGTETLITTSGNTPPVFNGVYAEFSASALWNDGIFLATDRIVLKFYGKRVAGGSDPTYDFQFGGSIPVRSLVPLPLTVIPVLKLDELQDVTIATAVNNDALIYESSTQLWKNKTIGGWNYIVKSANQDVTNSTTLVDDTDLQFSVVAGGQYMIELDAVISANSTANDYKNAFAVSSGTMKGSGIITSNSAGTIGQASNILASAAAATNTSGIGTALADLDLLHSIKIIYSFTASANATFKYQFAQNSAGVGTTARTNKGSILKYKKIN